MGTGDQGTRGGSLNATKAGIDDALRLSEMLKVTDADGFFGDTISSTGLQEFYDDALADGHPTAIQPEAGGSPGALNFSSMGWGYCALRACSPDRLALTRVPAMSVTRQGNIPRSRPWTCSSSSSRAT